MRDKALQGPQLTHHLKNVYGESQRLKSTQGVNPEQATKRHNQIYIILHIEM